MEDNLLRLAERSTASIVTGAIGHDPSASRALIVYDDLSPLSTVLRRAYAHALPHAQSFDFSTTSPDDIRGVINELHPKDLVVLVQSSSFRLNEFRFRLELFARDLAVIEHPHLARMESEEDMATYLESLFYDKEYYHRVGHALRDTLNASEDLVITSASGDLVLRGPCEDAKLNIGDYRGMKNTGGQFPIGEVFTEAKDLRSLSGWTTIFAFGDATFKVVLPERPIRVRIENGMIVQVEDSCPEFDAVLAQIQTEEDLWVREIGFGLNRAYTRHRHVPDVGSYERWCGLHISLGQKHTIYAKEGMPKRSSKYHVDVFLDVSRVTCNGKEIFAQGAYCWA